MDLPLVVSRRGHSTSVMRSNFANGEAAIAVLIARCPPAASRLMLLLYLSLQELVAGRERDLDGALPLGIAVLEHPEADDVLVLLFLDGRDQVLGLPDGLAVPM